MIININSILIINLLILLSISRIQASKIFPGDKAIRVCIVESFGNYKKAPKFCPVLEATSNLECVVGVDRLDCVRRIHKGTADFAVLTAEDLISARWSTLEISIVSELRGHDASFEYEIVAVVSNMANIHSIQDLKGSSFCHPGYGLGNHWTEVLANYFENTFVPRSCDAQLSIMEDKISSTSKFFGPSCKAGPWVSDPKQDRQLKQRYRSLCQNCFDPYNCDIGDKHWGRMGPLYCLTDGGGDVAWVRLDDARSYFGLTNLPMQANISEYSFLCADGYLQPISSTIPCVWVAKPWPVIAAHQSYATQIQNLVTGLNHDESNSWKHALLSLLETYHMNIIPLDNIATIDSYLNQAIGFQSAYSFPECNPPRSIVFCTTTIVEHIKCSWLQEASQAYGVQPNIQCVRSAKLESCLNDVKYQTADIVVVDHENRIIAQRDYNLIPLLYEFSPNMHERYVTIAIVQQGSKFHHFNDLMGKRICLPSYEGPAYLSILDTIVNGSNHLLHTIESYFHRDSCTWNPNQKHKCSDDYKGDEGALRCLAEGADAAFLSSAVYKQYTLGNLTSDWSKKIGQKSFRIICPYGDNDRHSKFEYCYTHWTTRGHLMTHNSNFVRYNEMYNSLKEIDKLFGNNNIGDTRSFTMYGIFDKNNNVIFRDGTQSLKGIEELNKDYNSRLMENIYFNYTLNRYHQDALHNKSSNIYYYFNVKVIILLLLLSFTIS